MSKFSLDVLNRCVYPYLKSSDPDVLSGAVFGEDVALTKVGGDLLVSHLDPIVGAVNQIGYLAVHVACNDIATSGARPRWILVLVLVPHKQDEQLLAEIMADIRRAADEVGVAIIGGHTGYSSNLSRPLVAVTALGVLSDRAPILTRGARIGDHVFLTKGIALEGTAILASDFVKTAKKLGLTEKEIIEARHILGSVSVLPEAIIFAQAGATTMHDVTRGGLLETLLEISQLSGVKLRIDANQIPIPAVVERFAQAFQFDPLKMISSGTLIATIPPDQIERVQSEFKKNDIVYADIGEVASGKGVEIFRDGKMTVYQEIRCEEDELARMWEIYQPDNQQ